MSILSEMSEALQKGRAKLVKELVNKAIAVSYTHLDVYKRQMS